MTQVTIESELAGVMEKQARFAQEYLIDLNGYAAAVRAGYSPKTARAEASRLLTKVNIRAFVKRKMHERGERTNITAERVLEELARVAFGDIRNICEWDAERGVTFKTSEEIDDESGGAIAEVSEKRTITHKDEQTTVTVNLKVKMHDKIRALDLLGRHLGLWETPVADDQYAKMTMAQLLLEAKKIPELKVG